MVKQIEITSRYIGFRVPIKMFNTLKSIADTEGKLISEIVREKLNKEPEAKEKIITKIKTITKKIPLEVIQLGTCSICKKPMTWRLPEEKKTLDSLVNKKRYYHGVCEKEK